MGVRALCLLRVKEKPKFKPFQLCSSSQSLGGTTVSKPRESWQVGPHCKTPAWPLPPSAPWKTKLSFSERNVRSHSTSVCIHDQQAGAAPGQSLRAAAVSATPTPTPHQSPQHSRPCCGQLPGVSEALWVPSRESPGQG